MEREKLNSGEVFEPATVKYKFNLTGEGRSALPFILDLKEEKIIITDIYKGISTGENTYSLENDFKEKIKVMLDFKRTKPNFNRLFKLYAKANNAKIDYENKDLNAKVLYKEGIKEKFEVTSFDLILKKFIN
jgi:hypothetical protein